MFCCSWTSQECPFSSLPPTVSSGTSSWTLYRGTRFVSLTPGQLLSTPVPERVGPGRRYHLNLEGLPQRTSSSGATPVYSPVDEVMVSHSLRPSRSSRLQGRKSSLSCLTVFSRSPSLRYYPLPQSVVTRKSHVREQVNE